MKARRKKSRYLEVGLYFGEPWGSVLCDSGERWPTPVGENCVLCLEPIEADDRGVFMPHAQKSDCTALHPAHRECALCMTTSGIGHHLDHDFWCLNVGDPHAGLGYRESARRVWAWYAEGRT